MPHQTRIQAIGVPYSFTSTRRQWKCMLANVSPIPQSLGTKRGTFRQ